jgi:hypothetical protein
MKILRRHPILLKRQIFRNYRPKERKPNKEKEPKQGMFFEKGQVAVRVYHPKPGGKLKLDCPGFLNPLPHA